MMPSMARSQQRQLRAFVARKRLRCEASPDEPARSGTICGHAADEFEGMPALEDAMERDAQCARHGSPPLEKWNSITRCRRRALGNHAPAAGRRSPINGVSCEEAKALLLQAHHGAPLYMPWQTLLDCAWAVSL